jgi:hypothetical protein
MSGTPFDPEPTYHRDDIDWPTILGVAAFVTVMLAITLGLIALAEVIR